MLNHHAGSLYAMCACEITPFKQYTSPLASPARVRCYTEAPILCASQHTCVGIGMHVLKKTEGVYNYMCVTQ